MSDAKTIVSPGIDIVIVNWNSGELLADCLRSIETAQAASSLPVRVMVVDNASADGSHRRYAGAFPVELICNAANEGFARAAPWLQARAERPRTSYSSIPTRGSRRACWRRWLSGWSSPMLRRSPCAEYSLSMTGAMSRATAHGS